MRDAPVRKTIEDQDGNFITGKRLTKIQAMRRRRKRAATSDSLDRNGPAAPHIGAAKASHGQRQASLVSLRMQRKQEEAE
jgi:hypothetical protein